MYNNLAPVRNGLIAAIHNAQRKCTDKKTDLSKCEHTFWEGGEELLIDTANTVLVRNFKVSSNLNYYSLKKSTQPSSDTIWQSFPGVNGLYYSFVDFEKEFSQWVRLHLTVNPSKDILFRMCFPYVTYWDDQRGWVRVTARRFIDKNYRHLLRRLEKLNIRDSKYDIALDGLDPYIFESSEYKKYFNTCGDPKDWIYPVMRIFITVPNSNDQDHFDFLKTDDGYKMISVSLADPMSK